MANSNSENFSNSIWVYESKYLLAKQDNEWDKEQPGWKSQSHLIEIGRRNCSYKTPRKRFLEW